MYLKAETCCTVLQASAAKGPCRPHTDAKLGIREERDLQSPLLADVLLPKNVQLASAAAPNDVLYLLLG